MELAILILGLIVGAVGVCFGFLPVLDSTRQRFHALQPDVQVAGAHSESGGGRYVAVLTLQNRGKSTAYNGKVTLDGWSREANIPIMHPVDPPGFNEYEVQLPLGQDAPIRTSLLDSPRLRIRYRDGWQHWYEIAYPVQQTPRDDGRYNVGIKRDQATVRRPSVGFFQMRKHLREAPGPVPGTRS